MNRCLTLVIGIAFGLVLLGHLALGKEGPCGDSEEYCQWRVAFEKLEAYKQLARSYIVPEDKREWALCFNTINDQIDAAGFAQSVLLRQGSTGLDPEEANRVASQFDIEKLRGYMKRHGLLPPPPATHSEIVAEAIKAAKAASAELEN